MTGQAPETPLLARIRPFRVHAFLFFAMAVLGVAQVIAGRTAVPALLRRLSVRHPMPGQQGLEPILRLSKGLPAEPVQPAILYVVKAVEETRLGQTGGAQLWLALAAYARGQKSLGEGHEFEAARIGPAAANLDAEGRERFELTMQKFARLKSLMPPPPPR